MSHTLNFWFSSERVIFTNVPLVPSRHITYSVVPFGKTAHIAGEGSSIDVAISMATAANNTNVMICILIYLTVSIYLNYPERRVLSSSQLNTSVKVCHAYNGDNDYIIV